MSLEEKAKARLKMAELANEIEALAATVTAGRKALAAKQQELGVLKRSVRVAEKASRKGGGE